MQFWLDRADLSPLIEKQNQSFPAVVDPDYINKWAQCAKSGVQFEVISCMQSL